MCLKVPVGQGSNGYRSGQSRAPDRIHQWGEKKRIRSPRNLELGSQIPLRCQQEWSQCWLFAVSLGLRHRRSREWTTYEENNQTILCLEHTEHGNAQSHYA